jgi:hypothetical protein
VRDIKGAQVLLCRSTLKRGAVVVFPGPPRRAVGHCGIVVAINPVRVVHCSALNWRTTGRAVCETNDTMFRTTDAVYGWPVALREGIVPAAPPAAPPEIVQAIATAGQPPTLDAALVHAQAGELWPTEPVGWWARLCLWLMRRGG